MTRTCWEFLAEWVSHAPASARNHPSNKQTPQGDASQVSTLSPVDGGLCASYGGS